MSMISLTATVSKLDALEGLRSAAASAFVNAIESSGQYAVEVRPDTLARLRSHLETLAQRVAEARSPAAYQEIHAAFRGELRGYREQADAEIRRLREDLAAAAQMMETFSDSVSTSGEDHERQLKEEFRRLENDVETGDLNKIRTSIHHAVQTVEESCEQMRRENLLVVAQLRDEIRALHQEAERCRRARQTDQISGAWTRDKLDTRIADLILVNQPFCILLIGIRNLREACAPLPPGAGSAVSHAILDRAMGLLGEEVMLGRWSETAFAALFDVPEAGLPPAAGDLEQHLDGTYTVQLDGESHPVDLRVAVELVERAKDSSEEVFFPRLGQAAFSVVRDDW